MVGTDAPRQSNSLCPLASMAWQRPNIGSRVNREVHARFWEHAEVVRLHEYLLNQLGTSWSGVTRLPPGAEAFARTDDYADFGFTLGDNVMSFQGHPEQSRLSMQNFLDTTPSLSAGQYARAAVNIGGALPDGQIWGAWMMRFFLS